MAERKLTIQEVASDVFATDSVDAAEVHRRWAIRQAIDKIVGGPLPYDPEVHLYYPTPDQALQILVRSVKHTALLDYRPTTFEAARTSLVASYKTLGITLRAPFATAVAVRMLEQGNHQ